MTETAQRAAWKSYGGNEGQMVAVSIGSATIKVARPTLEAWRALEAVFDAHGYVVRGGDTHGYVVRNVKGTQKTSLHAHGIAVDINAPTNPLRETPSGRKVRFSSRPTQAERARDVEADIADTDMTPQMIEDIRAVCINGGKPLFGWGGWWTSRKDAMHFYVDVGPDELARGIDWSTVRGATAAPPLGDVDGHHHHHGNDWEDRYEEEIMNAMDPVARFRPLLDLIARYEGTAKGDNYNETLGYGAYTGGDRNLSDMTLDQIDALQRQMLDHPNNRFNSSALGRYQIVRRTLIDLRRQLHLSGGMLFSPELQDRCAVALIKRRGRSAEGLRSEWEGLKRASDGEIYAAYDAHGTQYMPEVDPASPQGDPLWPPLGQVWPPDPWSGSRPAPHAGRAPAGVLLKPGDRGQQVKALQETLSKLNYQLGEIDGIYGSLTTGAVAAFQIDYALHDARTGWVDTATWNALSRAPGRPLSDKRRNTNAGDLRRAGSKTIEYADRTRYVGWASGILGALGLGNGYIWPSGGGSGANGITDVAGTIVGAQDALRQMLPGNPAVQELIENAQSTLAAAGPMAARATDGLPFVLSTVADSVLSSTGGSLAMLGIGLITHLFGSQVIRRRVEDQRNGANMSPLRS